MISYKVSSSKKTSKIIVKNELTRVASRRLFIVLFCLIVIQVVSDNINLNSMKIITSRLLLNPDSISYFIYSLLISSSPKNF